jgi:hypothetical protein
MERHEPEVNESDALALVVAAEAQDGRTGGQWQATPVDDRGWVFAASGVRSSRAYAVTPSGRIGAYLISTTSAADALERLAALPVPNRSAGPKDASSAEALVTAALAQWGPREQMQWRHDEIIDLGWLFTLQNASRPVRFVVTRTGQVALCPKEDASGVATAQELTARMGYRIPVADLVRSPAAPGRSPSAGGAAPWAEAPAGGACSAGGQGRGLRRR